MTGKRPYRFRCAACRRNAERQVQANGSGSKPKYCAECLRKRHARRMRPYNAARLAAKKAGVPFVWQGPGLKSKNVTCSTCRTTFLWATKKGWGKPPARCPSCALTQRRKQDREAWHRRRQERTKKEPDLAGLTQLPGCAPLGYRGHVDKATCVHCFRVIATMLRGRRAVCLTCAGKGLR